MKGLDYSLTVLTTPRTHIHHVWGRVRYAHARTLMRAFLSLPFLPLAAGAALGAAAASAISCATTARELSETHAGISGKMVSVAVPG